MSGLSDVALLDRLRVLNTEIAMIRGEVFRRAGVPAPSLDSRVDDVIEAAGRFSATHVSLIRGRGRSESLCKVRFAVMWVSRIAFGYSTPKIARALGNRDHTTILTGIRRAESLRATDTAFRAFTDGLLALFAPKENTHAGH